MKTRITILSIIATIGVGFNHECSGQLSITTDTVLQTSLCAGGTVIIPYTVSGGSYNFGNVFTAQLSGDMDILCQFGTFSNPIDIGIVPYWNSGFIIATVPDSTTIGSYRVRIIASNPVDTSSLSPNCIVILNLPPEFVFTIVPNDTVCQGDTVTLSVVDPFSLYAYSWSTGETTQSIAVTQSGSYTVTVRDTFGCESTSDTMNVTVIPLDATFTIDNQSLLSVSFNGPSGYDTYSWDFGDGNTSTLEDTLHVYNSSATYTVTLTITNQCGTDIYSTNVTVSTTGMTDSEIAKGLSIYPNPNTGQFTLTLPANQLNSSFVLYDLPGKEIIHVGGIKETKIKISVNNIPDGIYIYNIVNEHNIIGAGKLIINK